MIDIARTWYSGPIAQFIENGEPGNAGSDLQLHQTGGDERGSMVKHHTLHTVDHIFQPFFLRQSSVAGQRTGNRCHRRVQPGQTLSIYNKAKATNGLIKTWLLLSIHPLPWTT